MSYTDDAVLAKLSALNETQEGIVTVAQWIMFHRRHADRTAQLWFQRLKDSSTNKRLNLVYLANEVAQQSKARRKEDFLIAFSPIIADATAFAYKGATNDIQQKLRRVVEVWRQRMVFEPSIQALIESRLDDIDKSRTPGKRGLISGSGSLFQSSSSAPKELEPLVTPQQTVTKLDLSTKTSVKAANADYDKLTDPDAPVPSAPVYAARLSGLFKTLQSAENAVAECIQARKTLIEGLEKILDTNRTALLEEESIIAQLTDRKNEIDQKKQDVENAIMHGLATQSPMTPSNGANGSPASIQTPAPEPDRPEVEALTPPPITQSPLSPPAPEVEALSPPPIFDDEASLPPKDDLDISVPADLETAPPQALSSAPSTVPGADLLASLSGGYKQSYGQGGASLKKRKLNDGDEFPELGGDAMDDIDDDVADMLRKG